nr:DUF2905 domain-containing protein [Acetobacter sicerae]
MILSGKVCSIETTARETTSASDREGHVGRTLIAVGIAIVLIGLLWPYLQKLPIGRLPGDILIRRQGFTLYMPLATGLVLSVLFSFILWLVRR